MKIKAYKTEDEIPEGAVYMYTKPETENIVELHYFLVKRIAGI